MITYEQPPQHIVYAMDKDGIGHINISFQATGKNVALKLTNVAKNTTNDIDLKQTGTQYDTKLELPQGFYQYTITEEPTDGSTPVRPSLIEFGVGRVVVIWGHSLAEPDGVRWGTSSAVRAVEDYIAKVEGQWRDESKYINQRYRTPMEIWAEKQNLPNAADYHVGIWTPLAQRIADRDGCPIAYVNTAMGGSSVKMWADEAMNRPFLHGFASPDPNVPTQNLYNSGIPYFHFENVLKHIVNTTGVSAVLVQHGENDMGTESSVLAKYYEEVITKARTAANMPNLPFVIAKSAWLLNPAKGHTQPKIDAVLSAVDLVVKNVPNCYLGPDTHLLPQSLRGLNAATDLDDGHFNPDGSKEVARLWAEILTNDFFAKIITSKNEGNTGIVKNPLLTSSTANKNTPYEFPFILSMFALLMAVLLKILGFKMPTFLILVIGASAFGGSYLFQEWIKPKS